MKKGIIIVGLALAHFAVSFALTLEMVARSFSRLQAARLQVYVTYLVFFPLWIIKRDFDSVIVWFLCAGLNSLAWGIGLYYLIWARSAKDTIRPPILKW